MVVLRADGYLLCDGEQWSGELERASGRFELAGYSPVSRPVLGLMERPDGNNVSVEREGLLLAETQLRFQTGVELLRAERQIPFTSGAGTIEFTIPRILDYEVAAIHA